MTIEYAPVTAAPTAGRGDRLALRVLQLGAILVVLAATTDRAFELDRFLIPKELVLHATALLAGLLALRSIGRLVMTRVDLLLAGYLLLSALSAATSTNRWLGFRGLAVTASALLVFWTARALREAGLGRPLLTGVAFAAVLAAITSLVQAYGIRLTIFALDRAPGGTLGNRNFVGHAAAFGLPVVLLMVMRASSRRSRVLASIGLALVAAALVLTRSRAAWLACAVATLVFVIAIVASPSLRRAGVVWKHVLLALVAACCGFGAALVLPNALHWRSNNPYIESVKSVASYDEGSGHGRLIQYERSLRMALFHPLLGVGPGNWPVRYPEYAIRNDPSMSDSEPGMTFNPWPSSDWIAFISERGPLAAALMVLAFIGIAVAAFHRLMTAIDMEDALSATVLLSTAVAAGVAGAFDAVLLLGMPALLVWAAMGALWSPPSSPNVAPRVFKQRRLVTFAAIAICAIGVYRSVSQLIAIDAYTRAQSRMALERAALVDPGNYRLQLRLARGGKQRCAHALAAHALLPNAAEARGLARGCGE